MQMSFEGAARATGQEHRNAFVVMQIRVAERRTVEDQRMVQQRAVTVRRFLQLIQEVRNHTHVVFVDLCKLRDSLLVLAVMRSSMEAAGHTALGKRAPV